MLTGKWSMAYIRETGSELPFACAIPVETGDRSFVNAAANLVQLEHSFAVRGTYKGPHTFCFLQRLAHQPKRIDDYLIKSKKKRNQR